MRDREHQTVNRTKEMAFSNSASKKDRTCHFSLHTNQSCMGKSLWKMKSSGGYGQKRRPHNVTCIEIELQLFGVTCMDKPNESSNLIRLNTYKKMMEEPNFGLGTGFVQLSNLAIEIWFSIWTMTNILVLQRFKISFLILICSFNWHDCVVTKNLFSVQWKNLEVWHPIVIHFLHQCVDGNYSTTL